MESSFAMSIANDLVCFGYMHCLSKFAYSFPLMFHKHFVFYLRIEIIKLADDFTFLRSLSKLSRNVSVTFLTLISYIVRIRSSSNAFISFTTEGEFSDFKPYLYSSLALG